MKDKLWSSLYISIFPKQLEELVAKFPYADDSNFPGLNLLTVDVKLMPNAHEEYGLAFMPLLQKGDKESSFPPGVSYAVRSSIAALLQTGRAPKFARDITSLQNKWIKLEGLGDKGRDSLLPPSSPAKQWPSALPSPALDLDDSEHNGMKFVSLFLPRKNMIYILCPWTKHSRLILLIVPAFSGRWDSEMKNY